MTKEVYPIQKCQAEHVIQLSFWPVGVTAIPQPLAIVLTNQMSKRLG